jgi:hypothetical protein
MIRVGWLPVAAALVAAGGCGTIGDDPAPEASGPPDGLLTRSQSGAQDEMDAVVGGVLELDSTQGCILISGNPVVWPSGTRLADQPPRILLPNGVTARDGDIVTGTGGEIPATGIGDTAMEVEGDVKKALTCKPSASHFVVFTTEAEAISVSDGG